MNIVGIIPARYGSTRFPGKPLVDIAGKSLIQRVYEQAKKCAALHDVIVATDDERIAQHVVSFGGQVVMTPSALPSGTDRCFAALEALDITADYVVNIQGDEPLIAPKQIAQLVSVLDGTTELATLIRKENNSTALASNNEVKVVLDKNNQALYFSRACIPAQKGIPQQEWPKHWDYYLHVGLYAYRTDVLKAITRLVVSPLEALESLEQLRWIYNGFKIQCVPTDMLSPSVDVPEDVAVILEHLRRQTT